MTRSGLVDEIKSFAASLSLKEEGRGRQQQQNSNVVESRATRSVQNFTTPRDENLGEPTIRGWYATIPSFPRGTREKRHLFLESAWYAAAESRGGVTIGRYAPRLPRRGRAAHRTPSEGRDAARVVAPITHTHTHIGAMRLYGLSLSRARARMHVVPLPCGDETKYSRTDRFDVEGVSEKERERGSEYQRRPP